MCYYMDECSNPRDEVVDLWFSHTPVVLTFDTTYRGFIQKYMKDGVLSVDCMVYIHFELVSRFNLWDTPAKIGMCDFIVKELAKACYDSGMLIPCNLHHQKIVQNEEGSLYGKASQWLIHDKRIDKYIGIDQTGVHKMSLEEWRQLMIKGIEKDAGLSDQMMELNNYDPNMRFGWLDNEYPGFRDKDQWFLGRMCFKMDGNDGEINISHNVTNYATL